MENYEQKNSIFIDDKKFGFDIFETIFFNISCIEEYFADENQIDLHLRMKSEELG
ncbi:MAG: hypothetical protein R2771_09450 [Saprospiraceae bacterium]